MDLKCPMSNCMQCYFLDFTDPFEVQDFDVRAAITVSAHSEEYNQDSVLLTSVYNDQVVSGANYFAVVAPITFETPPI
jgi:hypothetical protein